MNHDTCASHVLIKHSSTASTFPKCRSVLCVHHCFLSHKPVPEAACVLCVIESAHAGRLRWSFPVSVHDRTTILLHRVLCAELHRLRPCSSAVPRPFRDTLGLSQEEILILPCSRFSTLWLETSLIWKLLPIVLRSIRHRLLFPVGISLNVVQTNSPRIYRLQQMTMYTVVMRPRSNPSEVLIAPRMQYLIGKYCSLAQTGGTTTKLQIYCFDLRKHRSLSMQL